MRSQLQRRLAERLADERGIALVLAIAVMMVLTIGTVSVIGYSASNETSSRRSTTVQQAFNLAESGIADAVGILANPSNQFSLATASLLPAPGATPLTGRIAFDWPGERAVSRVGSATETLYL